MNRREVMPAVHELFGHTSYIMHEIQALLYTAENTTKTAPIKRKDIHRTWKIKFVKHRRPIKTLYRMNYEENEGKSLGRSVASITVGLWRVFGPRNSHTPISSPPFATNSQLCVSSRKAHIDVCLIRLGAVTSEKHIILLYMVFRHTLWWVSSFKQIASTRLFKRMTHTNVW